MEAAKRRLAFGIHAILQDSQMCEKTDTIPTARLRSFVPINDFVVLGTGDMARQPLSIQLPHNPLPKFAIVNSQLSGPQFQFQYCDASFPREKTDASASPVLQPIQLTQEQSYPPIPTSQIRCNEKRMGHPYQVLLHMLFIQHSIRAACQPNTRSRGHRSTSPR